MRPVLLASVGVVTVGVGIGVAWRLLAPPAVPEETEKSLDQRPYEETTDKEREDWMRKLGYVD